MAEEQKAAALILKQDRLAREEAELEAARVKKESGQDGGGGGTGKDKKNDKKKD